MFKLKQIKAGVLGITFTILGILLRFFAYHIAWPKEYSYSGPRENTVWAIQEGAYQDIGVGFFIFGLAILIAVIVNWLWIPSTKQGDLK